MIKNPIGGKEATKTTREQLLELLQRRQQVTVEEMAQALGLAAATVRRHLDILQRDQLVSWTQARGHAGRPHFNFSLTDKGQERLPRQYDQLAASLLLALTTMRPEEMAGRTGQDLVNVVMSRIGHTLAQEWRSRVAGKDLKQRVAEVAQILDRQDQAGEWTETKDGFCISCYNCTYLRVATAYPAICLSHLEMMSDLLEADVWREECQATGDGRCTYVVSPKNPHGASGAPKQIPSPERPPEGDVSNKIG